MWKFIEWSRHGRRALATMRGIYRGLASARIFQQENMKLICMEIYRVVPHVVPQMCGICNMFETAGNVWSRGGPALCAK